jgi:hypothetical protein
MAQVGDELVVEERIESAHDAVQDERIAQHDEQLRRLIGHRGMPT